MSAQVADTSTEWTCNDKDVVGYYGRLREANQLYTQVALRVLREAQERQNAMLNGKSYKREYVLGDRVAIYYPTRESKSRWKQKHPFNGEVL